MIVLKRHPVPLDREAQSDICILGIITLRCEYNFSLYNFKFISMA